MFKHKIASVPVFLLSVFFVKEFNFEIVSTCYQFKQCLDAIGACVMMSITLSGEDAEAPWHFSTQPEFR